MGGTEMGGTEMGGAEMGGAEMGGSCRTLQAVIARLNAVIATKVGTIMSGVLIACLSSIVPPQLSQSGNCCTIAWSNKCWSVPASPSRNCGVNSRLKGNVVLCVPRFAVRCGEVV
jgi:hypothetical protein